jgi:predicted nucleic acid-binding protein
VTRGGGERILVLDSSTLLRAVLGSRVRELVDRYAADVAMCTPAICVAEVESYLAMLTPRRYWDGATARNLLRSLLNLVRPMAEGVYLEFREIAQRRSGLRSEADWPAVALALALNADIWTENANFVGAGLAAWTTDTVEVFLDRDPRRINEASLGYWPVGGHTSELGLRAALSI